MNIPQRQKKLLVVGTILLSIAIVYRLMPLFQQVLSSEDRALAEKRIITLQKQVLKKKTLTAQHIILERELNRLESRLLKGATPSLSAVNIQNALNDVAEKYEVDIQSVRVLKVDKSNDENLSMYPIISIQARMQLSIKQLKQILYGLAESSSFLVVDALQVQAVKKGQGGRIAATMTLKGLMLKEE